MDWDFYPVKDKDSMKNLIRVCRVSQLTKSTLETQFNIEIDER